MIQLQYAGASVKSPERNWVFPVLLALVAHAVFCIPAFKLGVGEGSDPACFILTYYWLMIVPFLAIALYRNQQSIGGMKVLALGTSTFSCIAYNEFPRSPAEVVHLLTTWFVLFCVHYFLARAIVFIALLLLKPLFALDEGEFSYERKAAWVGWFLIAFTLGSMILLVVRQIEVDRLEAEKHNAALFNRS